MQTQYRLLYRYINPTTDTPVTDEATYDKTEVFFNSEHKASVTAEYLRSLQSSGYDFVFLKNAASSGTAYEDYIAQIHSEADEERENIITSQMANSEKSNNLYVYNGTKKFFHKRFIPEQLGYLVRDWTAIPKNQLPSGPDDFSKHFVMLGGTQLGVGGTYLVCKPQYIKNYRNLHTFIISGSNAAASNNFDNQKYVQKFSKIENFTELVNRKNPFEWINPFKEQEILWSESILTLDNRTTVTSSGGGVVNILAAQYHDNRSSEFSVVGHLFISDTTFELPLESGGKNFTGAITVSTNGGVYRGPYMDDLWDKINATKANQDMDVYITKDVHFTEANIIRSIIPEHYEDIGTNPYIIKDSYKKIDLSPWMLHSVHNSLESGLTSARQLVSMIGINNVKLIKYVPLEQFVKIK